MPPNNFPGQKEGEVIQYLVRKHWIIYLRLFLFLAATFLVPLIGYFYLQFGFDFSANTNRILTLVFLVYLEILTLIAFIRWLEEELDLIIITNERVISIDQVTFMHRSISETELVQIQDVKHIAKGVLSNVFGFGSLQIQTAADKIVFIIHDVPEPYKMARKIMDVRDELKKKLMQKHGTHAPIGKTV